MKKLMIAFGVSVITVALNAATVNWGSGAMYAPDADGNLTGVTYNSGTAGHFALSPAQGSILNTAGSHTLNIVYNGNSTTKANAITVEEPSSIDVATPPTTTFYAAGEKFDGRGLYIRRNFATAGSDTVKFDDHTADFTFTPKIFSKTDTKVTITYCGKTTTQNITIKAVDSITVSTPPTKTTGYIVGQSFDPTGMVIKVTYNDNSTVCCISGLNYPQTRMDSVYNIVDKSKDVVMKNLRSTRENQMKDDINFLSLGDEKNIKQEIHKPKTKRDIMSKYLKQ